eukprot:snap_masked-scaffold_5-processed-gene-16.61-mRNA-1 protein AED:1.00 eAED:1.00 QI:0/0/0/0/1/1/2/0/78
MPNGSVELGKDHIRGSEHLLGSLSTSSKVFGDADLQMFKVQLHEASTPDCDATADLDKFLDNLSEDFNKQLNGNISIL